MDFKALLQTTEYDFIRTNERLGDRILLLGVGGSYAYGTNNESSDIDFRGVTLQLPSDLIGLSEFEQYADAQLRRLQNAIARDALPKGDREKHILKSVLNALDDFNRRYSGRDAGSIRLYIDKAESPELDTEIFVDAKYQHFPLRDYTDLWGTMRTVVRDYDKIGKRNKKKDDNHLNKHAMHLIRLFMMAIDILEKGRIITRRRDDLPTLLAIRRGDYMQSDGTFSPEFYEMLEEYEHRLDEAAKKTDLPDNPDMAGVERFVERVNRYAITGELI